MADLFLSYAREDRDRVAPLVEALKGSGLSVFWDRDVAPGTTWRDVLNQELQHARLVVVVWSKESVQSRWVQEEAEDASTRGCLVPVLIDAVQPPIGFRSVQAVDLSAWAQNREAAVQSRTVVDRLDTLVQSIHARLGSSPSLNPLAGSTTQPRRTNRRALALAAGGVVLLGGAAWKIRSDNTVRPPASAASAATAPPALSVAPVEVAPPASVPSEPVYRRVFFENFEQSTNVDANVWILGKKGDWTGSVEKGEYRLCNASKSPTASYTSSLSYSEGDGVKVDQSNARVTVTVRLEPPAPKLTAAGILYRKTADSYYALALGAGPSVLFVQSAGVRLKILSTWGISKAKDGDAVKLGIESDDRELRLFVGDKQIDAVAVPRGPGDPGAFAMGNGCFRMDDLSVFLPK
jgi:hypothetical protein